MFKKAISFFTLILFIAFSVLPINLSYAGKSGNGISPRGNGISPRGDGISPRGMPVCDAKIGYYPATTAPITDDLVSAWPDSGLPLTNNTQVTTCLGTSDGDKWNKCIFVDPASFASDPANGVYTLVKDDDSNYKIDYVLNYMEQNTPPVVSASSTTGNNTFPIDVSASNLHIVNSLLLRWVDKAQLTNLIRNFSYPAGTYKSQYRVTTWLVRDSEGPAGTLCHPLAQTRVLAQDAFYTFTFTIAPKCLITSLPDMDFGETLISDRAKRASTQMTISCNSPKNAPIPYTLKFSLGKNFLGNQRRMKMPSAYVGGTYVPYDLYFLTKDLEPIAITDEPIPFDGHTSAKDHIIIGQVKQQAFRPYVAGTYTDVVVVTLQY